MRGLSAYSDRESVVWGKRGDLGGRRIIKKKRMRRGRGPNRGGWWGGGKGRLARQAWGGADKALARLGAGPSPRDSPGVVAASRTCLVALEGMVAVARHASNARVLIERLDSTLVTAFLYEGAQRIFAHSVESELALLTQRLWEGEGEPVRALRAARRRYYGWGPESTRYLSSLLKDEGRLAALTGDREGAIRAYQHYLALRTDPEPSMKPEVDRVRLELAKLVAEPRTR